MNTTAYSYFTGMSEIYDLQVVDVGINTKRTVHHKMCSCSQNVITLTPYVLKYVKLLTKAQNDNKQIFMPFTVGAEQRTRATQPDMSFLYRWRKTC